MAIRWFLHFRIFTKVDLPCFLTCELRLSGMRWRRLAADIILVAWCRYRSANAAIYSWQSADSLLMDLGRCLHGLQALRKTTSSCSHDGPAGFERTKGRPECIFPRLEARRGATSFT